MNDFDPIADDSAFRPGCEAGLAALQRLLDGEPEWDSTEAIAHRAACVDCREELVLARSLALVPSAVVVPSELAVRVLNAAVAGHRRRQFVRYAGAGMALAASVLVAVFLLQPRSQTINEMRTVAVLTPPKGDSPKPLGESVSEARDAIVSLTKRTAAETRDTSASLMPNPKLSDMPTAGEGLEPLADARTGAARSVQPLATSARRAMNLFLRAAEPPNKPVVQ